MSDENIEIFQEYSYKLRIKKNKLLNIYKDKLDEEENKSLTEYYKLLNINYIECRTDEEIWNLYDIHILNKTTYHTKQIINTSKRYIDNEKYIDDKGYYRYIEDNKLVHRDISYHEIYLKFRDNYSLNFGEYIVHHRDRNKLNNNIKNLQIITQTEHEIIHKIR